MSTHYEKFRAICLALPNTRETPTWGAPHFRVGEKIFTGCAPPGTPEFSFSAKLEVPLQQALVASDKRFSIAPYVGKHGWVDVKPGPKPNWAEIEALVTGSYRLIAPKKLVAELDGSKGAAGSQKSPAKKVAAKKVAGEKTAAKKAAAPKKAAPKKTAAKPAPAPATKTTARKTTSTTANKTKTRARAT